jgi:hypothetical protein
VAVFLAFRGIFARGWQAGYSPKIIVEHRRSQGHLMAFWKGFSTGHANEKIAQITDLLK